MIASLKGRLAGADADGLVVEVGGVGLLVHASAAAARAARDTRRRCTLQTHLVVREDALTLYGFATQRERGLFVALLGVSGLGPAKALALLSGYPVDTLQRGIATGDLALLASVSGIGKRTAERIVVELRDKLGAVALEAVARRRRGAPAADDPHLGARRPCRARLRGRREAEAALAGAEGGTEQRIKEGARGAAARKPGMSGGREADRVGAAAARADEDETDRSLRPRQLEEFVGREVDRASSSRSRSRRPRSAAEPIDHVLLAGPPGLGKTTLAHIVAAEMETRLVTVSGPGLDRKGDLVAILADLAERDVVFIDEVHRLNRAVEETLYPAMEDGVVDIIMGQGPGARSLRLDLAPFTLIGATTRASLLTKPLRDRFGPRLPTRSLRAGRAGADRAALRRDPRHRDAGRRGGRARPAGARHAAASPTACCACATSRRCASDGSIDHATAVAAPRPAGRRRRGPDRLDRELLR